MFHLHLSDGLASSIFALEAGRIALRVTLGSFFAISGFHKLFNSQRRASLAATFQADNVKLPGAMWIIPLGEMFGGLGLLAGALTPFAALGLMAICLGACFFDGRKRVAGYQPLDQFDRADDWLYLPETLYVVMLGILAILGAGAFSFDHLIFG